MKAAEESFAKESAQKDLLAARAVELEQQRSKEQEQVKEVMSHLSAAQIEPGRIHRKIESTETALKALEKEHRDVLKRINGLDQEMAHINHRKEEADKLKKSLLEKLDFNAQTIEKREQDVALVRANVEIAKAKHHDLVTKKVELNIKIKDIDSVLRHKNDQLNFANKDFENWKRQYKKKRLIADSVKQLLPTLEEQLLDGEVAFKTYRDEVERNAKALTKMRDEVDVNLAQFLQQEGFEQGKKKVPLYFNMEFTMV